MRLAAWRLAAVAGALALLALPVFSGEPLASDARVHRNYLLHCIGCHLADGSGAPLEGVPSLRGSLGQFLLVPGGREYIVQVPGVMNSGLNDREVADLMNWLLPKVSAESIPPNSPPYTADEISRLRQSRPVDFAMTRRQLLSLVPPAPHTDSTH